MEKIIGEHRKSVDVKTDLMFKPFEEGVDKKSKPSQLVSPPMGHVQAITLRSGINYEGTRMNEKVEPQVEMEVEMKPSIKIPNEKEQPLLEKNYEKFIQEMKTMNVNIPFLDMISEMPIYAKFLKEILSNKRKIEEGDMVCLTEECSPIILNKSSPLATKHGDSERYTIPVKIGGMEEKKALCDLGASVSLMPFSICEKMNFGDLNPTRVTLQLADGSIKYPLGVLEDVPLQVGKFFIPCDFIVMEMKED